MQDLAGMRQTRSMATATQSLTKRAFSMPMCTKTMKTMPLRMTAAMKDQFIKYADKRASDFVTVSQNPTETRESDLNFPEEWTFPDPLGMVHAWVGQKLLKNYIFKSF